jgi:zinc transport system ATP-binding protein
MQSILTVTDLAVSFDNEPALKPVSFSLDEGDSFAIIGPNGAGKSVLVKALLDMVPHTGTITWKTGATIGYIPQKIDADRHLPINLGNLLAAKASVLGIPKSEIDDVGHTVGLNEKILTTPIGHLSGGQFQRALIAFALLGKPNVLILDEPTASIDKPGEEQVYEMIHRLQDIYGMTIILVSHDLNFVYRYSTKVLCLNANGALCFGAPDQALTPAILEELYGSAKFYHHIHDDH